MAGAANQMHVVRQGSGRPLLMLHGMGGSERSWSTITGALSRDREVIAVDLPGFGQTRPLSRETSIATLAASVIAFMRQTGLQRPDMVGSSMGARLV